MEVSALKVSTPLSFNIKLPLSAYRDAPVESLETLHIRLKECLQVRDETLVLALHVTAGWIESYDGDQIHIYKLGCSEFGYEVLPSLTVRKNFSWILSYKKQIVKSENCNLIRDTPSLLNSGEARNM